jgi:hypothetical protein
VRSSEQGCNHDGSVTAVIASAGQKVQTVSAPFAIDVDRAFASPRLALAAADAYRTHSPPGAGTRPLALRI